MKTRGCRTKGISARSLTRLLNLLVSAVWLHFDAGIDAAEPVPLPKSASYQKIQERWSGVLREELQKAAEDGVAEAQLYFGFTEITMADEQQSQAWSYNSRALQSGPEFSVEERENHIARWSKVSEAEHRSAAEKGDRAAQVSYYWRIQNRALVRAQQGFEWIKKAAAQSLVVAEEEAAKRYLGLSSWLVITTDEKEGMKWLESAAGHGSEWALHKQADFLLSGRHGKPDLLQGLEKLRKCADRNCPRAQYELGMYYSNGDGEPRNSDETPVELLRKSTLAGYNKAIAVLADRYRTGLGVAKDWVLASELYHAALEADDRVDYAFRSHADQVLKLLDERYEPKTPLHPASAQFASVLSHYFKSAVQHQADSMYALGVMYLNGTNVQRNPLEAYNWFALAAERGQVAAVAERDKLKSALTREQLEQASRWLEQRRSRWFRNR